jgi:hypothetical protein
MTLDVLDAEYHRLLGYPPNHVPSDRARELAAAARDWYAAHGNPWTHEHHAEAITVAPNEIRIDGIAFHSPRLAATLRDAEAHAAVIVAVSAGPELEAEAQRLWAEEKPDEYFFLEVFGGAVVEHLVTLAGARLCAWADPQQMAVLPHYSPGYPEWDIAEQPALLALLNGSRPGHLEALPSGALRPRKSQLAVFGITRETAGVRPLSELVPCRSCTFAGCQFRRVPYLAPLPAHQVNLKALRRWAKERLTLDRRDDGSIDAIFRYEGTTCTNMGRTLAFDYRVRLGPREQGYPIREQQCAPVAGDTGHTFMCRYIDQRDTLMAALDHEKPLLGRPLREVLTWTRPTCAAGCYCESDARLHKWGLVLETIQYALENQTS